MKFKLPFGLKDGKTLVHIDEVESGLKCNCVCPDCHHPLVARKGEKTAHHFAHHKGKECEHGLETALHLAAKEILERHKKIIIPEVVLRLGANRHNDWTISNEIEIEFDEVKLESYHQGVVPDVLVYIKGKPLMIEVTVTHKTGEEKIQKVREQGISILEINLEHFDRMFSLEDLEREVIYNTTNKKWLLNIKAEKVKSLAYQVSERKVCNDRGPTSCPIKSRGVKGYKQISWIDDCNYCEFCMGIEYEDKFYIDKEDGEEYWSYTEHTVICSGKNRIQTLSDLVGYINSNNVVI